MLHYRFIFQLCGFSILDFLNLKKKLPQTCLDLDLTDLLTHMFMLNFLITSR